MNISDKMKKCLVEKGVMASLHANGILETKDVLKRNKKIMHDIFKEDKELYFFLVFGNNDEYKKELDAIMSTMADLFKTQVIEMSEGCFNGNKA